MKFIVASGELQKALNVVSGVISSSQSRPILENFLFELENEILKITASDDVSGIKDFRYRKVTNDGPGEWSNWMMFNSYAPIKFTNEEDWVKRIEVAFRDYGNNITQPEYKWHKVLKVKK